MKYLLINKIVQYCRRKRQNIPKGYSNSEVDGEPLTSCKKTMYRLTIVYTNNLQKI